MLYPEELLTIPAAGRIRRRFWAPPGRNLIFRIGEGERHDGYAADRYMYNAMAFLWRDDSTTE